MEHLKNSYKYYISTNAEKSRKKLASTKEAVIPDDSDVFKVMTFVKT